VMRVTVKLFAILRERANTSELQLDLADRATVADARQVIVQKLPEIAPLLNRVAFAVNRSYVSCESVLDDGDELALIPPVSGG
jgi:molybdopterin converting factor subunit 1